MVRGVRWYPVGFLMLGGLAVLAGCSAHNIFVQREQWRHDAEEQCLSAGAVRESAGLVRIKPITGPGMCGADFPLKVSVLAENTALGYDDEFRPPANVPRGSSASPRWPVAARPPSGPAATAPADNSDRPISLSPPGVSDALDQIPEVYDFRRPYGGARSASPPSAVSRRPLDAKANAPDVDFSPVPYDRRPVLDVQSSLQRGEPPASAAPMPQRSPPPVIPLGHAPGTPVTGAIGPVSVSPAATLACPIVSALDQWIANSVQPAAMRWFGQPVIEIHQISAYSCRGMNGDPNAHISEHAFGNALDIASFTFADGHKLSVQHGWKGAPEEQGFLHDVQAAACDTFTTVLAPGYNVYHYNHIHVDLMRRRNGHRACQPRPVSGEEVAARARSQFAARRGEPSVTGSVSLHRLPSPPKRIGSNAFSDERSDRDLPDAIPGEDGAD